MDGKGLGGTRFRNGTVSTSPFSVTDPTAFFIVYEVECATSKDLHRTRSWVRFVRKG